MPRLRPLTRTAECFAIGLTLAAFSGVTHAIEDAPRPLWTTSRIHGTPDPPDPFVAVRVFPNVAFEEPLAISPIPGTNLFIVAERGGRVYTFENRADATKKLLIDVGRKIYGVAAHPKFNDNGSIFVTSIVEDRPPELASRLSRIETRETDAIRLSPGAETVILEWRAGGHNSGCIRFGPDGYLYLATGDGSGWGDWYLTGQKIDDLLASILRIDIDRPAPSPGGPAYGIPPDNPFVDVPGARPEVYSYGHRNVWKFSFDPQGRLWAGDVGADLWESIHLVEPGGNYGWSLFEGSHPFRLEQPAGPTPHRPPIVEHPHSDFRSITGGHVSTAETPKALRGRYLYGDYDTGRIWSFLYREGEVREHRQLADTQLRIVAFAQGHGGEVYALDFASGTLHSLAAAPPPDGSAQAFPRRLSDTGLFAATDRHEPAPGLIPYSVNAEVWTDGATKQRFIALPGDARIDFDAVTYPMPPPGWRFPDGSVLVQTLSIEMTAGDPASKRRLETRILHHTRMPGSEREYGAQVWRGYSYVWNDEQSDAELVPAKGLDRLLTIADADAPDGTRQQTWRIPSRSECLLCHTTGAKYALGVNTPQMNRSHVYRGGIRFNQLAMLERLGVFSERLPAAPRQLPRLASPNDAAQPIDERARAYLHANCSHCHRLWGGGNADFQLQSNLPLAKTHTVGVAPRKGTFQLEDAALVVPGHPERSVLPRRMEITGFGRMPRVGSNVVDQEGVALIREWISAMEAP